MGQETAFGRVSEIQDEILRFTWEQVGDRVDKFYVQGKVTDDDRGNITSYEGNLNYAAKEGLKRSVFGSGFLLRVRESDHGEEVFEGAAGAGRADGFGPVGRDY